MKSGIDIEEIEVGNRQESTKDDCVLVECLFFLNQGEQVEIFGNFNQNQFVIDLNSRDYIPGLLYGIVGMREGGIRKLKISPHLAFGEKGTPNKIPPNSLIICKVKLLKIVDKSFSLPNPFSRSRQIVISHRGEAASKKPKWSFGIINDGEYGLIVEHPIPEMTWRHTRNKRAKGDLSKDEMNRMFPEVRDFPVLFPNEIVENLWADMSEKAGNTPRERHSNTLCINVLVLENEKITFSYYVTENNEKFWGLILCKYIAELLGKEEIK